MMRCLENLATNECREKISKRAHHKTGSSSRLLKISHHIRHWLESVLFQQFQALFNSLFKVLFIFPSRYLFAIGLSQVFSFRWSLSPVLAFQSRKTRLWESIPYAADSGLQTGFSPSLIAFSKWLMPRPHAGKYFFRLQRSKPKWASAFQPELFPLHSPLLRESLLVSFPPLSYMFKFSGSSYSIWDRCETFFSNTKFIVRTKHHKIWKRWLNYIFCNATHNHE